MASSDGMNGRGNDFDDAYNTDAFIDNSDSTLNAATQAEAAAAEAAAAAAVRDDVYCHLTARRAVARAALYLGTIDYMSVEALDTLAGVLCSYLSRIGQTLAVCTEASGRSSSHVHVLDCLRAVELCTEAAVQRVHFEGLSSGAPGSAGVSSATTDATNLTGADVSAMEDAAAAAAGGGGGSGAAGAAGGGDSSARRSSQHARIDPVDQTSWKGLAAFCFGPNWHEPLAATTAAADTAQNGAVGDLLGGSSHHGGGSVARRRGSLSNSMHSASGGGGKVGPSSLSMAGTNSEMMLGLPHQQRGQQPQGWDAPYPEDICAWPVVSSSQPYTGTANPHAMSPFTVDSLHNHTTTTTTATTANATMAEEAQQLYEIPDVAFLAPPRSGWGRLEPGGGTTETGEITLSTTATVATSAADAADAATDSTTAAAAAGKRKQEDEDDSDSMPAKKKTKFSNDDNDNKEKKAQPTMAGDDDNAGGNGDKKTQLTATGLDDHNRRPFYVPRHFPPFPRPADAVGRTVLDDDTLSLGAVLQQEQEQQASRKKKKEASSTKAATARGGGAKAGAQKTTTGPMVKVRSALVRLGTPWGSGWDRDPTATAAAAATSDSLGNTNVLPNGNRNTEDISAADDDANHDVDSKTDANKISVPVGRTTEPPRDNNNNNDASGGGGGGPAQIVPLNRASGSRVSRILEGSMDAAPVM